MFFYKSDHFYDELIREDCPAMDLSVNLLGIGDYGGRLVCSPKHSLVLSGVEESVAIWQKCGAKVECSAKNGDRLAAGQEFMWVRGTASQLHRALKITQNLMEYMSGISTRTASMLARAREVNPAVQVAVTRKNFPGAKIQCLEAALSGGAVVHRLHLSDSVLFFDQHRIFLDGAEGSPEKALREFAKRVPDLQKRLPERKLCAEIDTPEEACILAEAGLDIIQCEKFSCDDLRRTVEKIKTINPRTVVVAAGGVNGENVEAYAATGVDSLVTSWVYFGKPADIKVVVEREG